MRFTLVVYVSHKVNVLVTDIILNITSQEHLIFTSLHIGLRLFELFSKEVRVKKQQGMPLIEVFKITKKLEIQIYSVSFSYKRLYAGYTCVYDKCLPHFLQTTEISAVIS